MRIPRSLASVALAALVAGCSDTPTIRRKAAPAATTIASLQNRNDRSKPLGLVCWTKRAIEMQGVALFRAVLELGIATDYGQADAGNKEADLAALFPKIQAALLQAKADLATIAGSSLPPEVQPFFARLQQAADQSPEAVDMSDDPIRSRVTATNRALEDRFSFDTYPGAVGLVSAAKANPKVCPDW